MSDVAAAMRECPGHENQRRREPEYESLEQEETSGVPRHEEGRAAAWPPLSRSLSLIDVAHENDPLREVVRVAVVRVVSDLHVYDVAALQSRDRIELNLDIDVRVRVVLHGDRAAALRVAI